MDSYGLVLSGGGAKGAYQVGVLKALAELDINIEAISGASIGALNGSVIACADNTIDAAHKLQEIWNTLGDLKLFQLGENLPASIQRLIPQIMFGLAAGLQLHPTARILSGLASQLIDSSPALFENGPLEQIVSKNLDFIKLKTGLPLYVSVFENDNYLSSTLDVIKAEVFGYENQLSTFEHIQSLPIEKQKEYILASAALPLIFEAQKSTNGQRLTDGGQGGWISAQGNTPIQPLIDTGCKKIIVTHLSKGSLWNRHDFDAEIYEIRPTIDFGALGVVKFDQAYIDQLIQAGYEDTTQQLGKIFSVLNSCQMLKDAPKTKDSDYDSLKTGADQLLKRLEQS
ncbi:Hypothetical protein F387_00286 [Wohlfahrtiimonas chitiniclastica SH04]|uniref:PNPLA domain-containing protein n=1 Tax=Wohlfahrtiimonas chitiniclastica SH04 TaxID=1261130 RepID=L8XXY1_9GAMM|nr:patatin-like phospholipase family protein [Wohlfahrtiimonas chitiniclastica]ELV08893.1 Hypothetical protein F387_00286 [Wohlfahrtiimonas chitiniclastica SH04]